MWMATLTRGRAWDQARDTARIREAFVTLGETRTTWPAPVHFLEALPPVEQKALDYEIKPVSPQEALQIIDRLRREIGEPVDVTKPVPSVRAERVDLAAVEAQLHAHYSDRKSAAAGDVP